MNQNQAAPFFQNELTAAKRIIHTPSIFARSTLLYLQEVGKLSALRPHISSRDNLPSYLFFTVTAGKGILEYQGTQYPLAARDCVFIDCRSGYSQMASDHRDPSGTYDELWSLSWLHFSGAMMDAIFNKYRERGGKPVFSCPDERRYTDLVEQIFTIASSDSYVRDMQIAEKLTGLLSLLMEDAWSQESAIIHSAPKRKLAKDVKEYIDLHYMDKMSLESLAGVFYINKEYLSHLFKEEYGFTVNGYIAQIRVSQAKNLLRFTAMTIEQIGAAVGIEDPNYFSRTFKRVEGVSPSRYRADW